LRLLSLLQLAGLAKTAPALVGPFMDQLSNIPALEQKDVEMLIVIVKCIYNWYKIYLILVAYFGRYSIHESLRCDRD